MKKRRTGQFEQKKKSGNKSGTSHSKPKKIVFNKGSIEMVTHKRGGGGDEFC